MTVGELREVLEGLDEDLPVLISEFGGIGLVEVTNVDAEPRGIASSVELS
ncbi:hypothetical protein [Actinomadura sp. WMMB 499]|nr:hypothetical protein [Actinomadura sp. WMMB 499]